MSIQSANAFSPQFSKFCIDFCDVLNFGFRETGIVICKNLGEGLFLGGIHFMSWEKLYQVPGNDRVILSLIYIRLLDRKMRIST